MGGSVNGTIGDSPRLINWLRVAAHPTATKALAVIQTDLDAGRLSWANNVLAVADGYVCGWQRLTVAVLVYNST